MPRDPHAGEPRFEVKVTAESHFSWLRTLMSTERTLMSWVRTGTALIGFGFTIFQVAARFHPGSSDVWEARVIEACEPRYIRRSGASDWSGSSWLSTRRKRF